MIYTDESIVNQISIHGIDCFERPYLMAIEQLTDYYVYYLLLFKDLKNSIYSNKDTNHITKHQYDRLDVHHVEKSSLESWIINCIKNNKKIIIPIDLFYSENHKFYFNIKHSGHYLLIQEYDEFNKTLIVLDENPEELNSYRDTYNPYYRQSIKLDKLLKLNDSYIKYCTEESNEEDIFYVFEVSVDKKANDRQMGNIIKLLYINLLKSIRNNTLLLENKYIDSVYAFNYALKEEKKRVSIYPTPQELEMLFNHITSLEIQKRVLQITLGEKYTDQLNNCFYSVLSKLQMARKMLIKQYYLLEKDITENILEYIIGISIYESKLYDNILNIIESDEWILMKDKQACDIKRNKQIKENIFIKDIKERYHVPMQNYYNHKCLIKSFENKILDCFIDNGERIIADKDLMLMSNVNKEYVFRIPFISDSSLDNISCSEEIIKIEYEKPVKSILIMGFAELSNYSESAEIIYNNNVSEKIEITFSNLSYAPIYNEKIVWEGKKIQIGKKIQSNCNMYGIKINLRNNNIISKISLPNCPNIHILAITLL